MLLAGPALADTVWLDNGDRLSGEIVLMDGGKLALKTRYAGQVLIHHQFRQTPADQAAGRIRAA